MAVVQGLAAEVGAAPAVGVAQGQVPAVVETVQEAAGEAGAVEAQAVAAVLALATGRAVMVPVAMVLAGGVAPMGAAAPVEVREAAPTVLDREVANVQTDGIASPK